MTIEDKKKRYLELAHAMQSGVAMKMNYDQTEVNPKHLRTGVNASMTDHSALVALLIKKGIITEDEIYTAMIEALEQEVALYEAELSAILKANITLR